MDKNEKYLKSIDNTLKDIFKELKKQGRPQTTTVTVPVAPTLLEWKEELLKKPICEVSQDEIGNRIARVLDSEYEIPIIREEFERVKKILHTGELVFLNPEGVINNFTSQHEGK